MAQRKASAEKPTEDSPQRPAKASGGGFKRRGARLYNVEPEGVDPAAAPSPEPRRRGRAKSEGEPKTGRSSPAQSSPVQSSSTRKAKRPRKAKSQQQKAPRNEGDLSTSSPSSALPSRPSRGLHGAARDLVRRYALWSAGVGVIPFLLFDLVALPVLLTKMLREMAGLYGVEYSQQRTKIYIASLLGVAAPASALTTLGRVFRFSPGAGFVLGPTAAWASTWAIGQVFIQHFELGGTLLDFDAEAMRGEVEKNLNAEQKRAKS